MVNNEEVGIGHNSEGVVGERLRSFLERIERLEEEKKELSDDIKDIYTEAKFVGFDVAAMRFHFVVGVIRTPDF